MEEIRDRYVKLEQESVAFTDRGVRDDGFIYIKLAACRAIGSRAGPDCPQIWDSQIADVVRHFWINLQEVQRVTSPYRTRITRALADFVSASTVPESEHAIIMEDFFQVIDAAVTPDFPINLEIWDLTVSVPVETKRVPATSESIEGLERVRLDGLEDANEACSICLVDYDGQEQLVTRMPCSHYYHQDCILQWLHINHLCPMCRFAMPTQPAT